MTARTAVGIKSAPRLYHGDIARMLLVEIELGYPEPERWYGDFPRRPSTQPAVPG